MTHQGTAELVVALMQLRERTQETLLNQRTDYKIAELEKRITEHVREQLSLLRAEFKRELLDAEWGPEKKE